MPDSTKPSTIRIAQEEKPSRVDLSGHVDRLLVDPDSTPGRIRFAAGAYSGEVRKDPKR